MSRVIAQRYQLDREIGRGGMGAVWLGQDVVLGRPVALKRIGLMPGAEQSDLDRVQREARVAAMLHHEHVVSVFDLVQDDDQHWLVMEYVEGGTLADRIRGRGSLSPDDAAELVGQAALALAAAHRAGIVHRDVKPSNIMVTDDGRVKLADFGIARRDADSALTQTGLVTGSPGYLAPEVAAGGVATSASDIWSLGATIFHAVAGRMPYDTSENLMGALYRIVNEDPPRTEAAGWLAPLLRATMHRDPESRWSADQVASFLRSGPSAQEPGRTAVMAPAPVAPAAAAAPAPAAADPPRPPPRDSRRRTPPIALMAAAVAAVLLIVLVAWLVNRDPGTEPTAGTDDQTSEPTNDPADQGETSEPPEPTPTPTPTATPEGPTEEEMVTFVQSYLADVADDPENTFDRLTPAFQQESGGFESYAGFWEDIESAEARQVSADPENLTVSYLVDYTYAGENGRRPPENVTLQLVEENGELLIAGES